MQDGVLAHTVEEDHLLVAGPRLLLQLLRVVVEVLPRVVRQLDGVHEGVGVRGAELLAVPAEEAVAHVHRGPADLPLDLVHLAPQGTVVLPLHLRELEVDALVRAHLPADLATDALLPVDLVLVPDVLRELGTLVGIEDGIGPGEGGLEKLL